MSKFLALMKKDWYVSRSLLLAPIWWTLGVYLLMGLAYLFSGNNSHVQIGFFGFNSALIQAPELMDRAFYMTNYGMAASAGFMCIIFGLILSGGALNRDLQKNSEIFFRSQPVSLWEITGSKYLLTVIGIVASMLIVTLLNFLIYNGFVWAVFRAGNLALAFRATMQGVLAFGSLVVFFSSLAFLGSAIFKHHAVGLCIAIIAGESLLATIFNGFFGTNFPILSKIFFSLVGTFTNMGGNDSWSAFLNWDFWRRLIISVMSYVIGSLVYQIREIQQAA